MTQSGEANLKTVEWGMADAPNTALLVHGLTGRAESFEALVEKLDPATGIPGGSWRFLAPDLRGRGGSEHITGGEGGIEGHARDILDLLDREGLERVVFAGHSMGAMIGVYLAAEHPERLSGLVLFDGGSDATDDIVALTDSSVERLKGTYASREAYLDYMKSQPIFEDRWDEYLERYFARDVRPGDDGSWHPRADLETVQNDREKMRGYPLSELWTSIQSPTLILLSTVGLISPGEGFILPPDEARRMEKTIPNATLVEVEDTNHYDIVYSAPRTTVEAVREFLGLRSV